MAKLVNEHGFTILKDSKTMFEATAKMHARFAVSVAAAYAVAVSAKDVGSSFVEIACIFLLTYKLA